ncbi:hypothetical protein EDD15DRAFT_2204105 [Pisolithus albus]|nr:hypothetical protein EDD15DRAFT_2204105 [Pisolithus albus]
MHATIVNSGLASPICGLVETGALYFGPYARTEHTVYGLPRTVYKSNLFRPRFANPGDIGLSIRHTALSDTQVQVQLYATLNGNGTCAQAPRINASCFKSSEGVNGVDHTPSRYVSVHCTPYVVDSIAAGVARGTAPVGCIAPVQSPVKEADNGTRCLQIITCATVSTHFAGHGVEGKPRAEEILCRWEGCFQSQKRHNFVRHVREAHLGHRRGTTIHNPQRRMAFPILDVNRSRKDTLDLQLADCS